MIRGQKEQGGSPTLVNSGHKEQWGFPTLMNNGHEEQPGSPTLLENDHRGPCQIPSNGQSRLARYGESAKAADNSHKEQWGSFGRLQRSRTAAPCDEASLCPVADESVSSGTRQRPESRPPKCQMAVPFQDGAPAGSTRQIRRPARHRQRVACAACTTRPSSAICASRPSSACSPNIELSAPRKLGLGTLKGCVSRLGSTLSR